MSGHIEEWVGCFHAEDEKQKEHATAIGFYNPNFFSPACLDLLRKICIHDPRERLSLEQVSDHPWFNPQQDNTNIDDANQIPENADGKHAIKTILVHLIHII